MSKVRDSDTTGADMLIVAGDMDRTERDLTAGELACPDFHHQVRPWDHAGNRHKSRTSIASVATLFGFGFYFASGGRVGLRVAPKTFKRLKVRLRQLTRRNWGVSMEHRLEKLNRYIAGWCAYFGLADGRKRFEAIDEWLRRRLRAVRWRPWKRARTPVRELRALGMPPDLAYQWGMTSKGVWRIAGSAPLQRAMPNRYWHDIGLRGLAYHWHRRRCA